jgi:glutathione S-transferase
MDRFFDLHVMDAAQHAVNGAITGDNAKRRDGLALSVEKLDRAYGWLETRLAESAWACGDGVTMADCAAAPSLFYADWVHRIPEACAKLRAYRARLLARPSVVRAVDGARPYRHLFPLGAPDRD